MNPGEFKKLREGLGFSAEHVAKRESVDVDIVLQWDSGKIEPPKRAVERLMGFESSFQQSISSMVSLWTGSGRNAGKPAFLYTFRTDEDLWAHSPYTTGRTPASFAAAKIHRIRDALEAHGVEVVCAYVDMQKLAAWLRENRKIQSLETIQEWWEAEGAEQHKDL